MRYPEAESQLTNPPGHLWRDEWTALSRPLSRRSYPNLVLTACGNEGALF
jgi:hypothetical protein